MECFLIYSNDIEGRTDPHFYKPDFRVLTNRLKKLNHKPLGEIVKLSGETWNQKDFFDTNFPYIEISEIDIITGEIKNVVYTKKNEAPSRAKMIVRQDDIIVSTTRPSRGAIAFIDKAKDGFIASTGFAILRELKISEINKAYLFYTLRTNLILNQMLQRSSGGNYPAITSDELKKVIIPLPPLETQNRIVSIMQSAYEQKKKEEREAEELLNSFEQLMFEKCKLKLPKIISSKFFSINSKNLENALNPERYANRFSLDTNTDWIIIKYLGQIIRNTFSPSKTNPHTEYDLLRIDDLGNNPQRAVIRKVEGKNINGIILKVNSDLPPSIVPLLKGISTAC